MKKLAIILSLLTLGLFIGVCVLLYPAFSDYVNSKSQSRVVARYVDDIAGMDDSKKQAMLAAARDYNQRLLYSENRFRPADQDAAAYKQLLNTGRGVMGILAIDKINVKLAIYHGTDEGNLQVGLGHMQGTSLPVGGPGTHACITGHRGLPSSTLLSDLDRLTEGDSFVIYVMGETLTYRVDQIQTVEPQEVQSLGIDPDMDYCTLVTCTPYGVNSHRLLVRGRRTENALNAGWETVYAGARHLDKPMAILICLIPALPLMLLLIILRGRKIRKGGIHHR